MPKWDIFMLISWIFVSRLHVYYVYFVDDFKINNVGGCACYNELLIVYIFFKPTSKKTHDLIFLFFFAKHMHFRHYHNAHV